MKKVFIKIQDGYRFKQFCELCKEIKNKTGNSPMDCIGVDQDFKNGFIMNISDSVPGKWVSELSKYN